MTQPITPFWKDRIKELSEHLKTGDINEFLKWKEVKYTMFVGNSPYVAKELYFLLTHDWKKWKPGIQENSIGSPTRFILYPWSSGNLIHNAYHLARFEYVTEEEILSFDTIFEFGGGYGSMARIFHNLGYKGKYVLYDLPEFSRLQKAYLECVDIDKMEYLSEVIDALNGKKIGMRNVEFISKIEDIPKTKGKTLFIATWSLSESPVELRAAILNKLDADAYLFAYQESFGDINNIEYFNKLSKNDKYMWFPSRITHLPIDYYLFGIKSWGNLYIV